MHLYCPCFFILENKLQNLKSLFEAFCKPCVLNAFTNFLLSTSIIDYMQSVFRKKKKDNFYYIPSLRYILNIN